MSGDVKPWGVSGDVKPREWGGVSGDVKPWGVSGDVKPLGCVW